MVFWTIAANSRHLATQFITQWVSSGHINVGQKLFKRACLGSVKDTEVDDLWEAVDVEHLDLPLYCK